MINNIFYLLENSFEFTQLKIFFLLIFIIKPFHIGRFLYTFLYTLFQKLFPLCVWFFVSLRQLDCLSWRCPALFLSESLSSHDSFVIALHPSDLHYLFLLTKFTLFINRLAQPKFLSHFSGSVLNSGLRMCVSFNSELLILNK